MNARLLPVPLGLNYEYPPWAYVQPPAVPHIMDSHAANTKPFTEIDATLFEEFISSYILVFTARPLSFSANGSRVNYAISYLLDIAGKYFWPIQLQFLPHPTLEFCDGRFQNDIHLYC